MFYTAPMIRTCAAPNLLVRRNTAVIDPIRVAIASRGKELLIAPARERRFNHRAQDPGVACAPVKTVVRRKRKGMARAATEAEPYCRDANTAKMMPMLQCIMEAQMANKLITAKGLHINTGIHRREIPYVNSRYTGRCLAPVERQVGKT